MSSFLLTSHNCDNAGAYNKIMSYYSQLKLWQDQADTLQLSYQWRTTTWVWW